MNNKLLTALLLVGIALLGMGGYLIYSRNETPSSETKNYLTSQPIQSTPNCTVSYSSGSCWTIKPKRKPENINDPSDSEYTKPKVTISEDGKTCTIVVPANASSGVKAETPDKKFTLSKGEQFEIKAKGTASFSSDHDRVDANGYNGWYDPYVDSPFTQNVGGLEFSIGKLDDNRYFAGSSFQGTADVAGIPIFRVIDRVDRDNKLGGFTVTISKK